MPSYRIQIEFRKLLEPDVQSGQTSCQEKISLIRRLSLRVNGGAMWLVQFSVYVRSPTKKPERKNGSELCFAARFDLRIFSRIASRKGIS